MPTSSSMQALYAPSPALGVGSPNLGTFSPRPEENAQIVSLLDILKGPEPLSPSKKPALDLRAPDYQSPASSSTSARIPWAALDGEGLSRDVLLMSDPRLIAQSLTAFHRSILDQVPENITVDFITGSDIHTHEQQSLIPLFGTDDQPHWLTKLLLVQVLGADTSSGTATLASSQLASPGRRSADDRGNQTSRTHSRSEVISVWIKVGELCRLAGDECSWRAIAAALCSRPIARLDKVWRRVDAFALAAVESWVYPGSGGEVLTVGEPKLIPWGGDIKQRIMENMMKSDGSEQVIKRDSLETVRRLFETLRTSFSLCPRRTHTEEGELSDDIRKMMAYWHDMSSGGGGTGSLAVKFQRVEQFMSLSLAAEPRRKGLFEPHYWSRSPSTHAPQASLLPLLFPEPLPSVHLVDRAQLLRGRVDSDASDVHLLRGSDGHLRLDMRRGQDHAVNNNNRGPAGDLAALSRGGTVIPVYNGDLLLVVQPGVSDSNPSSRPSSRAPSRPPSSVVDPNEKNLSRNPSIRVKPGTSQGLERKPSAARRNSLPSLSQRQNFVMSEPTSEPPLRVLVQAGTLNTLVDILVHGLRNVSVSVADDNGEMSLREGMTRELVVDHLEFAKVWWNVFRSFVTPLVFFELLRKIYITAQTTGPNPPVFDYLQVINNRREVLETIKEWFTVGGGTQDIVDEIQLYGSIRSFLYEAADHSIFQAPNFTDPNVNQAWLSLQQTKNSLSLIFGSQTMRPPVSRPPTLRATANINPSRTRNLGAREPPDIDHISPEDLVDNLDGMACATFTNVTEEDLYITADLLEVQTADRTGWFSPRDVGATEEAIEIQTMYSHIQEVEQSSMISELSQDAVYRLLPPGIRSCIRAYGILRKWLISKIVAPRLGLKVRQARIELLVQAIEVARLRNSDNSIKLAETACVRSFVESAITSALLSVESRMHHRAWQNVASGRGTHYDSFSTLLAQPFTKSISIHDPLTVDMGWLIERMLEVIATQDVIESSTLDGQNLVNFDKRRHLCNLIVKAPSLPSTRRRVQPEELNRRGFERLNNIEKEVLLLQFEHRGIKDEAVREAMQAPVNGNASARKTARPFQRLVLAQVEKNRRDKHLRSRLQKEKVLEQSKTEKRDDLLTEPCDHGNLGPQFKNNIGTRKACVKKTASELDFTPSGKPSLVLSLVDAQIAQFINNERSFLFQLDTEDGGHYLLQAMNKRDMTKWMETVKRVAKMAAKRRLTYLGNSPKPKIADHIHNQTTTPSRDPTAVFGVELQFLLQREFGSTQVPAGTIPSIIEQCLGEVETRGLTEVGIYRIAGAVSETSALRDAYNQGEFPIQKTTDIHAVCDLVKSWFRVLPEPIFPSTSYHDVIRAMQLENLDERLTAIRNVVQELPQGNFDLLKRVSEHLDKVTDFEEHNQMTAEALAIVFSPNLLRAPQNDFVMILSNMGHTHKLVKALITHFHVIFDEIDPEVEAHSEDDYDSPIPEEDEEDEEEQQADEVDQQTHYTPS
ncbi:hypothetical protein BD779DRAFT_1674611 [Infundibulicybe gibba]|nr:hypothetical protein BD779DRAFT_1674611 [Infundibulicybe gibba]